MSMARIRNECRAKDKKMSGGYKKPDLHLTLIAVLPRIAAIKTQFLRKIQ